MADKDYILKEIQSKYEYSVDSAAKQLQQYGENKKLMINALQDGMFDPILPYYNFLGSFRTVYAYMPLDKALFTRLIHELEHKGWQAGPLEVNETSASCTLKWHDPDVEKSPEFMIHLNAYGNGVSCRIVELKPQQSYDPGVYEWVCDQGADELSLGDDDG